jgi:phosphonate transport system substrate-binding protein
MNPYHYTVFHDVAGYRAFARQSNKKLKGLIVVRKSANITRLEDLGGSDLAFPSPAAFGASVIPRAELRSRGVAFTPQYVRSHDSVYRAVSSGLVEAGGGVLRTFNTVPANIRDQLKIIYRTSGYTPHAFAAHPDVSEETLATISKIMRETATLAPGHLKTLGMKGIEAAQNTDWDDVRSLKLKKSQTNVIAEGGGQCLSG